MRKGRGMGLYDKKRMVSFWCIGIMSRYWRQGGKGGCYLFIAILKRWICS